MRKLTTEEWVKKAKKIHGNKYDYSKVNYINNSTKICIICPIHGEFWMSPAAHVDGKQGCKICSGKKLTKNIFIEKARKIHGDKYDYSKVEYIDNKTKVCIICPIHGEFWVFPNNHLKGNGCPNCKKSRLENILAYYLMKNNIEFTYIKKFDWLKNKNPMSLDFYLPEYNVAIECQGEQHLIEGRNFTNVLQLENDLLKNKLCKENGVKLLYFGYTPINEINCNKTIYNKNNYFTNKEELYILIRPTK